MKTFDGDFNIFLNKIKNNEHFSLSRWGDGELTIIENNFIDIRSKGNGEFKYDPNDTSYFISRELLINSYKYKADNYYIGIACPCCVGYEKYNYMKLISGQDEKNLTWANIFVNSNYKKTIDELIPELNNHDVYLIINNSSKLNNLTFNPIGVSYIGTDAWINDINVIDKIIRYINENNIKNTLFLFAAGPLANIATHLLWLNNQNNTYIDIGSILDQYLDLKITRGYQLGRPTLNKTCIW